MRARNIKPGYFLNDDLAERKPLARLLFAGLWCMADREGRLLDRPKQIKASVLPYDTCSINELLDSLQPNFILRYEVEGAHYIQVINFTEHQNPHVKEKASEIPAPDKHQTSTRQEQNKTGSSPADSGFLIPDSLNPPIVPPRGQFEKEFKEVLWPEIWEKETRADSLRLVTALRKNGVLLETLIAGIREYKRVKESEGIELRYYMQPKKFFGRGEHWKEYAEKAEEREKIVAKREAEMARHEPEQKPPPTPEERARAKQQSEAFKKQAQHIASARGV